jgi:predicted nucleotidyltransferase component of viral defense system
MNVDPLIVEKDFWVCWTLKCLFSLPDLRKHLIFRGGTVLSKVYKVIHRFSEDIDLTVNRALLGFEGDNDPANIASNRQRDRLINRMVDDCRQYIGSSLRPKLKEIFSSHLSVYNEPWDVVIDEQAEDALTFKEIMAILSELESTINNK